MLTKLSAPSPKSFNKYSLPKSQATVYFAGQAEENFFQAVEKDEVLQAARLLTSLQLDIDTRDAFHSTALMKAAAKKQSKMVDFLLQRGADPTLKNKFKDTALHRAAKAGDRSSAISLIAALKNKDRPFRRVVNLEGSTALHLAAQSKNRELVQLLLSEGFDPHLKNHKKETPLHLAKKTGHAGIIKLLEKSDPGLVNQTEPMDADYRGSNLYKDQFLRTQPPSIPKQYPVEPLSAVESESSVSAINMVTEAPLTDDLSPFQRLFSRFMAGESLYEDSPEQVRAMISQPEILEEFAFRVNDDLNLLPANKEPVETALCRQYFQTSGALQQFWHRATKAITDKLPIELAQEYPDTRNMLAIARPDKWDTTQKKNQRYGFNNVAGMEKLKEYLRKHVINPLQGIEDDEFDLPKPNGLLLFGPSRTGKTHLAKALADELDMNFIKVSGADLFSSYQGKSITNTRDLFHKARMMAKEKPTILFFDEINQVIPKRENVLTNQGDMSRMVDQFLLELDEASKDGLFSIGTTNLPETIDEAVLQGGRLDFKVPVGLPDQKAREALLKFSVNETAKKPIHLPSAVYQQLAKDSVGFSAGDLKKAVSNGIRVYIHNKKDKPLAEYLTLAIQSTKPSNSKAQIDAFQKYVIEKELTDAVEF